VCVCVCGVIFLNIISRAGGKRNVSAFSLLRVRRVRCRYHTLYYTTMQHDVENITPCV
jgi:hypothetical protein